MKIIVARVCARSVSSYRSCRANPLCQNGASWEINSNYVTMRARDLRLRDYLHFYMRATGLLKRRLIEKWIDRVVRVFVQAAFT